MCSLPLYSGKQSSKLISKRPWLLGGVCIVELPHVLDTQGPLALGASVVTEDDSLLLSTIAVVFLCL